MAYTKQITQTLRTDHMTRLVVVVIRQRRRKNVKETRHKKHKNGKYQPLEGPSLARAAVSGFSFHLQQSANKAVGVKGELEQRCKLT